MAIYHYKPGSLIGEVQILSNDSGGLRAYLHARDDATAEQLSQVQTRLTSLGWKTVPVWHDGKPMLEVRGFKKREHAEAEFANNGWVVPPPSVQETENDKRSTQEKISNGTLKLAGISYLAGDAAFMVYARGKYRHPDQQSATSRLFNKMDIGAGIGYALGSLSLFFFGSRDQSQNTIETATRKVIHYAQKEKMTVGDDTPLDQAAYTDRSFKEKIRYTLAKYPSETLNSIYIGVGTLLGVAATYRAVKYHQRGDMKNFRTELWDVGLGSVTAASALAGLAIKEKKPEEGKEKPTGVLGKTWAWIQEKPLRATGIGFMVATGLHGIGTYRKWRDNDPLIRKYAVPRGIFVATNLFSEVMLALSSKGHGTGVKPDDSIDTTVIAATADLIARQPTDKREALIDQFAGYLASYDVLGGHAADHAAQLRHQLEGLQKNPWSRAKAEALPAVPVQQSQPIPNASVAALPGNKVAAIQHASMVKSPLEAAQVTAL